MGQLCDCVVESDERGVKRAPSSNTTRHVVEPLLQDLAPLQVYYGAYYDKGHDCCTKRIRKKMASAEGHS